MPLLLTVLVLACYGPALAGGLLWDDAAHVTRPDLQSWDGLRRIWLDPHATQQYYPVLHTAFWLEHRLWGDATVGYHLANVAWQVLACVLLAHVLRRLSVPGAVLTATLFAVHPVCVESVAWISEQKNTLSLVFYLAAALAYLRFDESRRAADYAGAALLFLLALGTKTVTATLPAALLLVFWWRRGNLGWKRDALPLLPWFASGVLAGVGTAWIERKLIGAEGAAFDLSLLQRLMLAGRVVWFYLGKLAAPFDLMFVYPRWNVPASAAWAGGLLGVAAVTAALVWFSRRVRGPLAAWLFFLGSLFPALGFFNVYPFLYSFVADHFQYLACLGPLALFGAGCDRALRVAPAVFRPAARLLFFLLIGSLVVLSNRQSRQYLDAATLYRATLARNPDCWMAHNNLGLELARTPAGEAEALAHYRAALRLKPDYAEAHNNLAVALTKMPGHEDEALAHAQAALQARPDDAEIRCNFANVVVKNPARYAEAIDQYRRAVALAPDSAAIEFSFANALAARPEFLAAALSHYERALRLRPDYVEAHVNLANALVQIPGRRSDALAHYARALELDPAQPEVHYDLANLLDSQPGREAEAIAHYGEALRLRPNYARAHNNLAIMHARRGEFAEARRHWETALRIDPAFEEARKNLELLERQASRH